MNKHLIRLVAILLVPAWSGMHYSRPVPLPIKLGCGAARGPFNISSFTNTTPLWAGESRGEGGPPTNHESLFQEKPLLDISLILCVRSFLVTKLEKSKHRALTPDALLPDTSQRGVINAAAEDAAQALPKNEDSMPDTGHSVFQVRSQVVSFTSLDFVMFEVTISRPKSVPLFLRN